MLLGVDVGGTFTDAVLVGPDGTVHTAKAPPAADGRRGRAGGRDLLRELS